MKKIIKQMIEYELICNNPENRYFNKFHYDGIIDTAQNIDYNYFKSCVCKDVLEFIEMLEFKNIPLSTAFLDMETNRQEAGSLGFVYTIYIYTILTREEFPLPRLLMSAAKNKLLMVYCAYFLTQYKEIAESR